MSNPAPEAQGDPAYHPGYARSATGQVTAPYPTSEHPPSVLYPTAVTVPAPPAMLPEATMVYQPSYMPLEPPTLVYSGMVIPNPRAPRAPTGFMKVPGYDPKKDYGELKGAKKSGLMGSGWNEETLSKILVRRNILELNALSDYISGETGKTLVEFLPSKGSLGGWFNEIIQALALGPLEYDVMLAKRATEGAGTKEQLLLELYLGRSNEDMVLLKDIYQKTYGTTLQGDLKGDISSPNTQTMFMMATSGQRPMTLPGYVDKDLVNKDVEELYNHGPAKNSKLNESIFCRILINNSDAHIAAIIKHFGEKYKSLSRTIKKLNFETWVKAGLLYIIHGVKLKRSGYPYGAWRDAKLIEASMKGIGTKDELLVWRIVRAHWDPARMNAIKEAYKTRYGKNLKDRVSKETSGAYKDILIDLINKA